MDNEPKETEISGEDLRAALKELKNYVDVTEKDLKTIYTMALKHAKARLTVKVPVRDIMTKKAVSIKSSADIHEASRLLSENNISGLPVVDDTDRVVGVATEADLLHMAGFERGHTFKDILKRLLGEPFPRHKTGKTIGDIMTSPAITASPDADIRDIALILDEKRIKRLPVVDKDNKLIGIISRGDIVRALAK